MNTTQQRTEPLVNDNGETVATLTWRDNRTSDRSEYALLDNATMTRRADGTVTVRIQDRSTGEIASYEFGRAIDAFYALGLSATHCNGINRWLGMTRRSGTAGRD